MSSTPYWPLPPQVDGCIDSSQHVRWYLRMAVASMDDGMASTLAERLGVSRNTVYLAIHRGSCTDDLAKRIEKLFGREYFPRELFNPEPELPVE